METVTAERTRHLSCKLPTLRQGLTGRWHAASVNSAQHLHKRAGVENGPRVGHQFPSVRYVERGFSGQVAGSAVVIKLSPRLRPVGFTCNPDLRGKELTAWPILADGTGLLARSALLSRYRLTRNAACAVASPTAASATRRCRNVACRLSRFTLAQSGATSRRSNPSVTYDRDIVSTCATWASATVLPVAVVMLPTMPDYPVG